MPRGDKSSYTGKQKRMAEHIEQGYEKRGNSKNEAERRAWATVGRSIPRASIRQLLNDLEVANQSVQFHARVTHIPLASRLVTD